MKEENDSNGLLTFGGHLEVLRQMIFRILGITGIIAFAVFCMKDITWQILLAPSEHDFVTYRCIERLAHSAGLPEFRFGEYHVDLIATELSSQFMTHITTALYIGMLAASPYILYELFRFVSPALYDNERRYSVRILGVTYVLFILGVLMSYYVLFPISFRFLGTYSVAERIHSTITLDSYISTFTTLTLLMGAVFQLPVIAFAVAKMGFVSSGMLSEYRKHAFLAIMVVAAVVTPPDVMTLVLVAMPLYLLYEISIRVVRMTGK
ncbi:MAG: twin-arginine translocase subunit TatC [Bacteroidales bacterium]|nr:twin-arginine translocase subunit TatC [Bacteroidales bacterium]MCM1147967.1 twin-arginine translocase subunit TatC [Bacteroidales bacterium]MCM1206891.1 twin-arginine translocase subunit TatC [Bacillota bacterium]MCM1509524.1 twin-arginine translocase subunit TatC [Clostridium sp.]